MVDEKSEADFRNEMAVQAQEQRDAMAAMDQFDSKLKGSRLAGDDSSSDEDEGPRRPLNPLELEKQKNQILMDKLFRA